MSDEETVPEPAQERETDQEIEDRHEKELAEERERRESILNPTEGETETSSEEAPVIVLEEEVAQDAPPEGTTADDT